MMPIRPLKLSSILKSIFAQRVGTTAFAQAVKILFSIGSSAIIARYLGPTGKGTLDIVRLTPGMLQLFLSAGLGPANVYHAGANRISVRKLAENSMTFSLLGTVAGLCILLLIDSMDLLPIILPGIEVKYLWIGMLALPIGLLLGNQNAILHGLQRIFTLNMLEILSAIFSFFMIVFFVVIFEFGIVGAICSTLIAQAVILFSTGWLVGKEGGSFRPKWNKQVVASTMGYGWKCYVGNLLQFFNYRLDSFIVNYFLGPTSVGIYGVSVMLAELLWQLPNAASFVIFPKSANSTQQTMNRFTPKVFWVVMFISITGAIFLAIFSRFAIRLIFSVQFIDAYLPLLVLLPGVVLLGSGKVLTNDIAGRGYPQYNSITSGVSLLATIIFDFFLIPSMGVVGAALASTISYTLTFILSLWFYKTVSKFKNENKYLDRLRRP